MNSATSASAVRFVRYARDSRRASSLASPGVTSRAPRGRTAAIASRAAPRSLPAFSRRSMRSSRPSRAKRCCASAMSSIPICWRKAPAGRRPATRRLCVSSPTWMRSSSPAASASASAAAGLSQTESSASIPVARTAVAPSGASGACSSRTRNGSIPSSCSVRSRPGRRARTSTTGLATATIGSFASVGYSVSSSPPVPEPCTDRSAIPNRLRAASCTSSAATRLMRCTASPSATPSAIATIATSARPGDCRSGPRTVAMSRNRHGAGVRRGPTGAVRIVIADGRPPARTRGRHPLLPPRNA